MGESSVFYLCLPGTAQRIERAVPGAKIIMILREPVDRAYSAYMHLVRDGREHLSFAEGLELEEERRAKGFEPLWWYKELSLYHKQVRHYLDVFGRERVKVLLYDELCANPGEVLRDIFVFLGVNEDAAIDVSVRYNVSGVPKSRQLYARLDKFVRHPSMLENSIKSLVPWRLRQAWVNKAMAMSLRSVPLDPELREQLRAYFAEDVEKLAELLGRDLSCWGYKAPYAMQLL